MKKIIEGIGEMEYKYSMYYKSCVLTFLGATRTGLIKLNCFGTDGTVTEGQLRAYKDYLNNMDNLNKSLQTALSNYRKANNISQEESASVSSVEFSRDENHLFLEVSWDEDNGLVAQFDEQYNVTLIEADSFL